MFEPGRKPKKKNINKIKPSYNSLQIYTPAIVPLPQILFDGQIQLEPIPAITLVHCPIPSGSPYSTYPQNELIRPMVTIQNGQDPFPTYSLNGATLSPYNRNHFFPQMTVPPKKEPVILIFQNNTP